MKNIEKLTEISLRDKLNNITINAFKIIGAENQTINDAILESKALNAIANKILIPGAKIQQISFLANIIQTLFSKQPKKTIDQCDFLNRFLLFGDNDTVCTLYFDIFKSKDPAKSEIINFIEEVIPNAIINAIKTTEDINSSSMAGVYRIFAGLLKFSDTKQKLQTQSIVQDAYLSQYPSSKYVLNMYWDSLILLMDEKIYDLFLPLIERALSSLSSIENMFFPFHSSCFRFLCQISQCTNAHEQLKGISQYIINVYKQFPNHTIALHSAEKLALAISSIPIIGPAEIMNLLPILEENIRNRKSTIVFAWSYKLLTDIKGSTPELTQLITNSVDPQILEILDKETESIKAQYGGEVPPPPADTGHEYSASEYITLFQRIFRLGLK